MKGHLAATAASDSVAFRFRVQAWVLKDGQDPCPPLPPMTIWELGSGFRLQAWVC